MSRRLHIHQFGLKVALAVPIGMESCASVQVLPLGIHQLFCISIHDMQLLPEGIQ